MKFLIYVSFRRMMSLESAINSVRYTDAIKIIVRNSTILSDHTVQLKIVEDIIAQSSIYSVHSPMNTDFADYVKFILLDGSFSLSNDDIGIDNVTKKVLICMFVLSCYERNAGELLQTLFLVGNQLFNSSCLEIAARKLDTDEECTNFIIDSIYSL